MQIAPSLFKSPSIIKIPKDLSLPVSAGKAYELGFMISLQQLRGTVENIIKIRLIFCQTNVRVIFTNFFSLYVKIRLNEMNYVLLMFLVGLILPICLRTLTCKIDLDSILLRWRPLKQLRLAINWCCKALHLTCF